MFADIVIFQNFWKISSNRVTKPHEFQVKLQSRLGGKISNKSVNYIQPNWSLFNRNNLLIP